MTTRYYLDTEFMDDGVNISLVSIALVCSDGRELYLGNAEFDESTADDWLKLNVLVQLPTKDANVKTALGVGPFWRTRAEIRAAIVAFVHDEGEQRPEFWAFYASYDWFLFCRLFGRMIDLPKHFPWLVNDLKTWAAHTGFKTSFKELLPTTGHHDALEDARWNRDVHKLVSERNNDARIKQLAESLLTTTQTQTQPTLETVEVLVAKLVREHEERIPIEQFRLDEPGRVLPELVNAFRKISGGNHQNHCTRVGRIAHGLCQECGSPVQGKDLDLPTANASTREGNPEDLLRWIRTARASFIADPGGPDVQDGYKVIEGWIDDYFKCQPPRTVPASVIGRDNTIQLPPFVVDNLKAAPGEYVYFVAYEDKYWLMNQSQMDATLSPNIADPYPAKPCQPRCHPDINLHESSCTNRTQSPDDR